MALSSQNLVTGSYPNELWDYAAFNAMIENSNLFSTRAFYQNNPSGSVNTSSATYAVLQNYSMASNNLPSIFTFQGSLQFSALAPQYILFGLFRNGSMISQWAHQLVTAVTPAPLINLAIAVPASASPTTDSWDFKWRISGVGLTVTMAAGFRIVHYQI